MKYFLLIFSLFLLVSCSISSNQSKEVVRCEFYDDCVFEKPQVKKVVAKKISPPKVIKKKIVKIKQEPQISLINKVFFGTDSFELSPVSIKTLENNVKWMKINDAKIVTLAGFADLRGNKDYNIYLSQKRAEAIKDFLVANNIDSQRINITSHGAVKEDSLRSEYNYERRVEFIVTN